jgi:hypothetical protein
MKKILLLCLSLLLQPAPLFGATDELRINIERVFMRLPNDYSVMYETTVYHELVDERLLTLNTRTGDKKIEVWAKKHWTPTDGIHIIQKLVADVPENKPMYISLVGAGTYVTATIHIHSASEVNGAGWISGTPKNTKRGQTSVVE